MLLKNSLYNSLGGVIRLGLGVISTPILIRILGLEEYGVWTLASSIVTIAMLADSGLSFSTTFFISQSLFKSDIEELSQTLSIILVVITIISTIISISIFFGATSIFAAFPKLTESQFVIAGSCVQLGAIVVWARLIQQVLIGIEQAYQNYGVINLVGTFQVLLMNSGMIAISFQGGRSIDLMKWQVLISILFLFLNILFVKYLICGHQLNFKWNRKRFLEILNYSLSTWVSSLGGVLFGQVDRLIVGAILGVESLGIYSAITTATVQINGLSAMPVQPIVPILSRMNNEFAQNNTDGIRKIIRKAFEVNCIVALGMGSLFLTFDFLILPIFLGNSQTITHINEFRFATIIYSIYSMNAVGYYIGFGTNSVNMCMKVQILSGIFSLTCIFFGIKYTGLNGAILGNSGYCLTLFLTFLGFRKFGIKIAEWMAWIWFPSLSFLALCISTFLIQNDSSLKLLLSIFFTLSLLIWFASCNSKLIRSSLVKIFQ